MSNEPPSRRRKGAGRAARLATRNAALSEDLRPVRAGLTGGQFRVFDDADIAQIESAIFEVLEQVGLSNPNPSLIEHCTAKGAILGEDGRIRFPRATVEEAIRLAGRGFKLCGRDSKHDLTLAGKNVHFGTSGAAVHIVDARTGEYRDSTLRDIYDMGRVVDSCDNIHFFFRTVVARDIPDPYELDINTFYAAAQATTKHIGVSFTEPDALSAVLKMCHEIAGSEEAWRARPFVSTAPCFVVPPLTFATEALECLEVAVRGGMPVLLLAAGQAGATSPAALAGAVVQEVAETLAALVFVNALVPGAPAICGAWPFVSDLRTGAMSGGSAEQAILMAGCAQMLQHFNLVSGCAGSMTDSKLPEYQAGNEKAAAHALIGNAGANMIYEAAGMHASLMGCCYETLVLDNDSIGAALRTIRGIEVTPESLSVDVIADVTMNGPNHFLGSGQTLKLMQTEYFYPEVGDRLSPKDWKEQGQEVALDRAERRVQEILDTNFPNPIPDDLDAKFRAEHPIKLPREQMGPNA